MNIIVVDNEKDSIEKTKNYIRRFGKFDYYLSCYNAQSALKYVTKAKFDIALLDIELPDINGIELAKKFKNIYHNIKIVFITRNNNYAAEAFDIEAIDYILKPIEQERLLKTFRKIFPYDNELIELKEKMQESQLKIQMFNKFMITKNNRILKWNRQKSYELIAYLIKNNGQMVHKEELCDLLWPELDTKKALVNLQTTISSIRKNLHSHNCNEITIKYINNYYIIILENVYVDSENFEKLLFLALETKNIMYYNEALKIYIGDYLDKDGWLWAEVQKQKLYKKYLTLLKLFKNNFEKSS